MKRNYKFFITIMALIYFLMMLYLLYGFRFNYSTYSEYIALLRNNVSLVPFDTIKMFIKVYLQNPYDLINHATINLVGNVILFIPLGYFITFYFKFLHNLFAFLLVSSFLIFTIEAIQLLTLLGRFDVDDIILNVIGSLMGYISYLIIHKYIFKDIV